jgi:hypothetical protein
MVFWSNHRLRGSYSSRARRLKRTTRTFSPTLAASS